MDDPRPLPGGPTFERALRERIKELTCLYGVSRLAQQGLSIPALLQGIADLLPGAWQFPDLAHGRITFDGQAYGSPGFREGPWRQAAELRVEGAARGCIEVFYDGEVPEGEAEGAFLSEERNLIEGLAREIPLLVEKRRFEEDRVRLGEQLRHADRLATLGQLAAGVAHELNEPLGGILGFAQLALKGDLPGQAREDLGRIVQASLHAREIVKKLLYFSRQMPCRTERVDLNRIVAEGLLFLESRCARQGVEVVRQLDPGLPGLMADPSQLHQLLVNLVVNAVQAMPEGGVLTLRTRGAGDRILLEIEDTGTGMGPEILNQIFLPFFTTKEVGQGTGLGLSVVHGIVTAHGGSLTVDSEPGRGSRFAITFPLLPEVPA